MRIIALITLLYFAIVYAVTSQTVPGTDGTKPIEAKRLPPEKAVIKSGQSFVDAYDFGAQLDALSPGAQPSPGTAKPVVPVRPPDSGPRSLVPLDFFPKTDVYLTQTAREAVERSAKWMADYNPPSTGRDGRVLYAFGAGLPSVVCAPLRVCMIELQPGEKIVGEPQIGDSVRWHLSPALFGSGEAETPVIVLKPLSAGLDTNLLITTDRRAYYLRLLSKPDDYVARVAFAYRVKQSMYIVDRLFERAELVLGAGKKSRKVKIERERED
jgi:type IV secretion system protein VirB9